MAQAKNWCFTLNNPTPFEISALNIIHNHDLVSYIVYQTEEGESGTPHIQGYVQLSSRKRMPQVKALLSSRAHVEVAKGSPESNRTYCTKDPRIGDIHEHGEMSRAGKRTDIEKFVEAMKENIMDDGDVLDKFPNILAKYPRFINTTRRVLRERATNHAPFSPREGWQTELALYLTREPDSRKIRWYFDEVGASGKSTFANGFDGGYIVTGGKHADILYSYNYERVVFFDWPRCSSGEAFPYAVLESMKNGYFLSTKYEPRRVKFNPPHVIVFSNEQPDKSKLSADRWDIHNIRNFI